MHEHWNNAVDRQYSRNLGLTNGIELVKLECGTNPAVALIHPASMSLLNQGTTISLHALAVEGKRPVRQVDFYRGSTLIGSKTEPPFVVPWTVGPTGSLQLKAVATDTNGITTTSALVYVRVEPSHAPAPDILHAAASQTDMRITFPSAPGRSYRIESAGSLPPAWHPALPDYQATADTTTLTNAITQPRQFYRVILLP